MNIYIYIYAYTHIHKYSKTSLYRPTMGPILKGPFKEVIGLVRELQYCYNCSAWAIVWDPNKAIDIGEWSICTDGHLEGGFIVHTQTRRPDRISKSTH